MFQAKVLILALTLLCSAQVFAKIDRLVEIENGLWRGSHPSEAADYDLLKQKGITTIVDLRNRDTEAEKAMAASLGITYINIPMDGFKTPPAADIAKILSVLQDSARRPLFIHCHMGRDRTGLISALYRVKAQGWSPEKALAEWESLGFEKEHFPKMYNFFVQETKSQLAPLLHGAISCRGVW